MPETKHIPIIKLTKQNEQTTIIVNTQKGRLLYTDQPDVKRPRSKAGLFDPPHKPPTPHPRVIQVHNCTTEFMLSCEAMIYL